jgi:PAS domain-containing protein
MTPTADQLLALLLAMPLPVALIGPDQRYVAVSQSWADTYTPGQTADSWRGALHFARFPQIATTPHWLQPFTAASRGQDGGPFVEVLDTPGDGTTVLQWWAIAWPGVPGGVLLVILDLQGMVAKLHQLTDGAG